MTPRPYQPFDATQAAQPAASNRLQAAPREARPAPRGNQPRLAGIASPPAMVPAQNSPSGFGSSTSYGFVQVAQFYYVPAVVLTDGRVYANFNGSFEQVLRRCPVTSGPLPPGFATPACWVVDSYGRYQVVQQR